MTKLGFKRLNQSKTTGFLLSLNFNFNNKETNTFKILLCIRQAQKNKVASDLIRKHRYQRSPDQIFEMMAGCQQHHVRIHKICNRKWRVLVPFNTVGERRVKVPKNQEKCVFLYGFHYFLYKNEIRIRKCCVSSFHKKQIRTICRIRQYAYVILFLLRSQYIAYCVMKALTLFGFIPFSVLFGIILTLDGKREKSLKTVCPTRIPELKSQHLYRDFPFLPNLIVLPRKRKDFSLLGICTLSPPHFFIESRLLLKSETTKN